jgi:NADPH2:quinone reductase
VALGARVIASAGGAEKCEIARRNGAHEVIDYTSEDLAERVMALTDGKGADVIYDSVGGDVTDRSLKCIAWNGRLLIVGFASGRIPEIKANRIMLKNIAVTGIHWGAYETRDPERVPLVYEALTELYAEGKIHPIVYQSYSLDELPTALAALGSRKTHGKVVITP